MKADAPPIAFLDVVDVVVIVVAVQSSVGCFCKKNQNNVA